MSIALSMEVRKKIIKPVNAWLESNTDESELILDTKLTGKSVAKMCYMDTISPGFEKVIRSGIGIADLYKDKYVFEDSYDILQTVVKVHIRVTKKDESTSL